MITILDSTDAKHQLTKPVQDHTSPRRRNFRLESAQRCWDESARKHRVIADCHGRVSLIIGRTDERMKEIADQTRRVLDLDQARIDAAGHAIPEDVAALAALEASWRAEGMVISATAVQKINAQTRRVLDLDQATAGISVKGWLRNHDLS